MAANTLAKDERLRGEKRIERLFREGEGGFVYPLKYVCRISEKGTWLEKPNVAVLFTVPKKIFKRANRRNLLRRRMKEAYRLNKAEIAALAAAGFTSVEIALIYAVKETENYQVIENGIRRILAKIGKSI